MVAYTMSHKSLAELRERLEEVLEDLGYGEESLSETRAAITRIAADLADDPATLMRTMRKLPGDYPEWRRSAKAALNHKRKDAHHLGNRIRDLRDERQRLENLISAEESAYHGGDPQQLLGAMVRVTGHICRQTGYRMTREEEGVMNAAKVSLGLLDKPFY